MRTKNIWKSLLMSAALLVSGAMVSCEKDEDGHPTDFDAQLKATASAEIVQLGETFTIDVVCNTDWRLEISRNAILIDDIDSYADTGSKTITVRVIDDPNDAEQLDDSYVYIPGDAIVFDFEADGYVNGLKFTRHSTVSVKVGSGEEDIEHAGTLEDPLSVVNARAKAIEAGENADNAAGPYYIKGVISKVSTSFAGSGTYGNANFYIKDNLTDEDDFYAFQVYYLGHKQWVSGWKDVEAGDQVIIYGRVYNYMGGTPETVGKGDGYIYSHNGETEVDGGGNTDPEQPTPGDTNFADGEYYLFGVANGQYHAWDGAEPYNGQLQTQAYSYDASTKTYTIGTKDSYAQLAAKVSIVKAGEGTYYIKSGDNYLYSTSAENHSLALTTTASGSEWTFTTHSTGGYVGHNNGANLGTSTTASSRYIRGMKNESSLGYGVEIVLASSVTIDNGEYGDNSGNGGGTTTPDPTPSDGNFESDEAFVCTASTSSNPSGLDASTFNGSKATGFKLGTGSKVGSFTSKEVGVTGDYTLSLYGVAWKGQKGTLKVSVNGGGSVDGTDTYDLTSNDGATGNAPFTITVTDSDKYTFNLKGLTATSTITFETVGTAYRVVVAGVHLTNGTSGGGSTTPSEATVDTVNNAFTGIGTVTTYTDWSGKTGNSGAVYAGRSAGQYGSVQLRTSGSNEGVVTTTSGGKVTKISVKWNSNTNSARVLDVYAKNEAYSSAADLFSSSAQGTKVGSIGVDGTELTIEGDYTYIGFRSSNAALYLDEVQITWE